MFKYYMFDMKILLHSHMGWKLLQPNYGISYIFLSNVLSNLKKASSYVDTKWALSGQISVSILSKHW